MKTVGNESIIKDRWKFTDLKLNEYLKQYRKINRKTQDRLQDVFNGINIDYLNINKPVPKYEREKFKRNVEEWNKDKILTGYFKYCVDDLLNKKNISYKNIIDMLIWAVYKKERSEIDEYENILFVEVSQNLYNQGIKEINPTRKQTWSPTWEYIWALLCLPNVKGIAWKDYVEALSLTYAQEIQRQTAIYIQQNKKLDINDKVFQNIINKQRNKYININNGKISGALESEIEEIGNKSLLKAGEDIGGKDLEARFIAVIDGKTTKMCQGLNNMLFKVNDWNRYYRYSDVDKKDVLYTTKGLEIGANLPPINNHFHYCRSTITYLVEMKYNELIAEYNQLKKIIPSEVPETLEEYAQMRYNIDGYYEEIKDKEDVGKHYNKHYEIKEESNILNHISFGTYYNGYSNARDKLSLLDVKNIGNVKLSTHAYDRILERKVDLAEIEKVLKEKPTYNVKNNSINYENDNIKLAIGNKTHDIATIINYKGW